MGEVEDLIRQLRHQGTCGFLSRGAWPSDLMVEAADTITALLSQLEEMRERERKLERGIAVAIKALGSLPDDALGFGESSDGSFSWPLRDELIDALDALLSQTDEGERMEGDGE